MWTLLLKFIGEHDSEKYLTSRLSLFAMATLFSTRCDSSGSDSAEITMCTLVWQRWRLTVLWQHYQFSLLSQWCAHHCHTNMNIAVIELSADITVRGLQVPPLSQRCQSIAVTAISCHRYHTSMHSNVKALSLSSLLHRCQFTSQTH